MKLPRIVPTKKPEGICRVKGCTETVSPTNTTKVCIAHMHVKPYCQCDWCRSKRGNKRVRIKTRMELKAEGLLL